MVRSTSVDSLKKILSGFNEIRIADFQRNYTWLPENVKQLWDDIEASTDEKAEHFISALVYEESEHVVDGDKVAVAEIVDGQQRLTTIFLIAARLRDEVERLDPNMEVVEKGKNLGLKTELERFIGHDAGSAEFRPNPLVSWVWQEALKRPVYSYTRVQQAKEDFEGRSLRKRLSSANSAQTVDIRNAYFQVKTLVRAFVDCVSSESEQFEAAKSRIHQMYKTLSERLKTLAIVTNSSDESLNIFLTLNDRGTDLGVFDLVRGHILRATTQGKSDSERTTVFAQAMSEWDAMYKSVASTKELDQFVRYWLHLRPEVVVPNKKPRRFTEKKVPGFVEEIIGKGRSADPLKAQAIWESFKSGISIHNLVMNPKIGNRLTTKAFFYLKALKEMGSSYRIFAYRLLDPSLAFDKQKVEQILAQLVRYYCKHFVSGGNAQDAETVLQAAALELSAGTFNEGLTSLTTLADAVSTPSEEQVLKSGDDMKRAFLFICEALVTAKVSPISEFDVEHIAPASPNDHWKGIIGGAGYKEVVGLLGNLTLLDPGVNKSIKQKPYSLKVLEFQKSNVEMAREVARSFPTWDVPAIQKRSALIVKQLLAFF